MSSSRQNGRNLQLSRLETERTEKRRRLEYIFQRKLELAQERARLEQEEEQLGRSLEHMDMQIDSLEEEIAAEESQNASAPSVIVKAEHTAAQASPFSSSVPSAEFLTDPHTQLTQHHFEEENIRPSDHMQRAPPRNSSVVGPLQLNPTKPKKTTNTSGRKFTSINKNSSIDSFFNPNVAQSPQQHTHAAPTEPQTFPWTPQVRRALREIFNIKSFRDQQEQIINATLDGRDVFVIMRTGGGKSLTYQLPAVIEGRGPQHKVTLVLSPLISLIHDQEKQMNQFVRNSAVSFTSGIGSTEHAERWNRVRDPTQGVCLIFVTPEKVSKSGKLKAELQKLYKQGRLGRFVIDECHCACQWGHDFRPDYTQLGQLKRHFPSIPVIAVTATASDAVRDDVCKILHLGTNYQYFRSSAHRPNLTYSVRVKPDNKEAIIHDIVGFIQNRHPNDTGIIYTFTKKEAESVAASIDSLGVSAACYHADVSTARKERVHDEWMAGRIQVVVATIAFGLGINKPNVRFVIHHSLSKSGESYVQESGRAGRDGLPADCVLYYSPKDVPRLMKMVHGSSAEPIMWPMIRYGQASGDDAVCKAILMSVLAEPNCRDPTEVQENCTATEKREVGIHARTVTQLLCARYDRGEQLTIPMLVKEWRKKPANADECVRNNLPKGLSPNDCERIIVALLMEGVLDPDIRWTKYDALVYLKPGRHGRQLAASENPGFAMRFPNSIPNPAKAATRGSAKDKKKTLTAAAKPKKGSKSAKAAKKKPAPKKATKAKLKKTAKKAAISKKTATAVAKLSMLATPAMPTADVIDLLSDDGSSDSSTRHNMENEEEFDDDFWDSKPAAKPPLIEDSTNKSDSENEFEG